MHAYGGVDPMMLEMEELAAGESGGALEGESCLPCHAPVAFRAASRDRLLLEEGVSCDVCHSMSDVPPIGEIDFLADLDPRGPKVAAMSAPVPTEAHESLNRPFFATSIQCAPCHQVNLANGAGLENTHREWVDSNLSGMGIECQDCHMPAYTGQAAVGGPTRQNLHRHTFLGVDAAFEPFRGIDRDAQKASIRALLENSVRMTVAGVPSSVVAGAPIAFDVAIENDRTGHSIPSGVSFAREMWIEVTLGAGVGSPVYHSGYLKPDGELVSPAEDPELAFFGAIAFDKNGVPTPFNFRAASVDESRMIPFSATRTHDYAIATSGFAPGSYTLDVALRFRAVRPSMVRTLGLERLLPIDVYTMAEWSGTIVVAP